MNFNSIFGNRYTQNRNEHLFESNCFNHQEFNAHFKREGNQEPNNTNLRRKTKGQEFNLNIENISEYYCTCGNSSQYEEQIEPLNQFVINNFWNCNEIITNKAELSTLKRIQHTHHNFPQIYQESELYWNRDNKLQGLEVECKVNQHFNSETKNLKMLTDRRSILISSFQQALVSQQM